MQGQKILCEPYIFGKLYEYIYMYVARLLYHAYTANCHEICEHNLYMHVSNIQSHVLYMESV